jgi:hypothetical protein
MSAVPAKQKAGPKLQRGRPHKPFHQDEDRYEVAFLEMCKRTGKNGRFPSTRQAAQHAVLLSDFDLDGTAESPHGPPPQPAQTGHRNSPIKPVLRDGFTEHVFRHKTKRAGVEHAFAARIKRLERKHREWMKAGSPESTWLDGMADAWMATVYPHAVRRRGLDPVKVCLTATARAGEIDFAERYLLPLLRRQDACEISRQDSTS